MKGGSKKKLIANIIITVAVFGFAAYYLTRSGVVTAESIRSIEFTEYLAVLAFFGLGIFLYALTDFLSYRTFTRNMPLSKCVMNTLAGNLGSNITPYKSAHYPLMAYYRYSAGIDGAEAVTGLIKCQIIYSITSVCVYTVLLTALAVAGTRIVFEGVSVPLYLVVLVGFAFHAAVLAGILILSFCAPLQKKALLFWGKIRVKLKKEQSAEEYAAKKGEWFKEYRTQIKLIFRSFARYLPACGVYFVHMFVWGSVQYISYLVFSGARFSISDMFSFYTLNLASAYITNIVPVPGGVGTAEVMFSLIYASVIPESMIGSVLILWRVGTYYAVIVIEAIAVPAALAVNRRKYGGLGANAAKTPPAESPADITGPGAAQIPPEKAGEQQAGDTLPPEEKVAPQENAEK